MEEWKIINGTDNKYSVSNLGNVKRNEHYTIVAPTSLHPNGAKMFYKDRLLKGYIDLSGYKVINIKINGISKGIKVHRLVAEYFIPNPNKLPIINHKDENKTNNHYTNLEWCNYEYNSNYGSRNDRLRKASGVRVAQYSLDGKLIKIWDSISQASSSFGCKTTANIRRVCKHLPGRKTYKGYLWQYVDKKVIGDSYLKEQIIKDKEQLLQFIFNTFSKEEKIELHNKLKEELKGGVNYGMWK